MPSGGIYPLKVAVLEANNHIYEEIEQFIHSGQTECTLFRYRTAFALVTGVSEELKGDVSLILVHLTPQKHELIHMIRDLQFYYSHIRVIFYSETNDFAEEIFQANPSYFLKLPINEALLHSALRRVETEITQDETKTVTLKFKGEMQKIRCYDIFYIESVGRKMIFHTGSGVFEVYQTMDMLLESLPENFRQCHRSYVVNIGRVSRVSAERILLDDMETVPVSRKYYEEIKALIT